MDNFITKLLTLVLAIILLSGCQIQGCIEADDFGYPKFTVTSRGYQIYGQNDNQTTSWYDSGYQTVAGTNLVIEISNHTNSAWTSWFGGTTDTDNIPAALANSSYCVPVNNDWCPAPEPTNPMIPQVLNFQSAAGGPMTVNPSAGCIFRGGTGLYGLVSKVNPNTTEDDIRYLPQGVDMSYTFHLGDSYIHNDSSFLSRFYNSQGNVINNAYTSQGNFSIQNDTSSDASSQYAGGYNALPPNNLAGELYFKILDRYYFDNGGSYNVWLKSGVSSNQTTPFSSFIQYVQSKFDAAQASIVSGFVTENSYAPMVRIVLILYVMFMGISFVMGLTSFSQKELAIHVFKIAIVIQCTLPSSWNFFNSYFFPIFTKGPAELICIYASAGSSGGSTCTPTTSLTMFDLIFHDLLSQETSIKIQSLFFNQSGGFQADGLLIVILIYIGIVLLMVAAYRAITLYFLAYVAISLMVVLTPIFIVFLLFKVTKPLFDNWIKQFITFTVQPIIVVTALSFGSSVLLQELHKMLGFRVCALKLIPNGPSSMDNWLAWKPDHVNFTGTQEILVPDYWTPDPVNAPAVMCSPYDPSKGCMDNRYLDLPYLRPYPINATYTADDRTRIMRIQNGGEMVTFYDSFYFLALAFLLYKLCGVASDIGKAISGGGSANLGQAAKQSAKGLRNAVGMVADKGVAIASGGRIMPGQTIGKVKEGFRRIQDGMARNIGGGITAAGKGIGRKIPGISQMIAVDDMRIEGRKYRHNIIDNKGLSIGGFKLPSGAKLDSIKEVGKMVKGQAASNLSGGVFGTDYNRGENKYNVLTRGDHVASRFTKAFGVVPPNAAPGQKEQILNYTSAQMKGLTGNLAGANRFLKMGAALALINPALGAGVAGVGVFQGARGVWKSAKSLYDLANGKVGAAQMGMTGTGAPGAGGAGHPGDGPVEPGNVRQRGATSHTQQMSTLDPTSAGGGTLSTPGNTPPSAPPAPSDEAAKRAHDEAQAAAREAARKADEAAKEAERKAQAQVEAAKTQQDQQKKAEDDRRKQEESAKKQTEAKDLAKKQAEEAAQKVKELEAKKKKEIEEEEERQKHKAEEEKRKQAQADADAAAKQPQPQSGKEKIEEQTQKAQELMNKVEHTTEMVKKISEEKQKQQNSNKNQGDSGNTTS